ncbi:MAG: hypothetical protein ACFE89_09315 [Candidatus Hodarchaeota archaeon]
MVGYMAVEDLLLLDHFLYSFNTPVFNRLKTLSDLIKNCEYSIITRPDTSYEGVYLFAQDGSYLEMYKNPVQTPNIFALAFSSLSSDQETVGELPTRFPTLQWASEQILDAENKPWYTYFGQAPIAATRQQGIVLWAMQYHNLRRHRSYQYHKKTPSRKKFTVQEFTATRFKIPPRYLEIVRTQSQWIPGNHNITDSKAVLRVLNPSLNVFEAIMEVDKDKAESKPVSVTMQLVEGAQITSKHIKGIRLTRQQNTLIINF